MNVSRNVTFINVAEMMYKLLWLSCESKGTYEKNDFWRRTYASKNSGHIVNITKVIGVCI